MRRPLPSTVVMVLAMAATIAACSTDDSAGQPGPAFSGNAFPLPPMNPAGGNGGGGGGGGGGLSCIFGSGIPTGCYACLGQSCSGQLVAALGTSGIPTAPGGACSEYLTCLQGCNCDFECAGSCQDSIDQDCVAALANVNSCEATSCSDACGNDTGGGGGGGGGDLCGDGQISGTEQCDGANIPTTCADLGYTGGSLACVACEIDDSGCTSEPAATLCDGASSDATGQASINGSLAAGDPTDGPQFNSYYDLYTLDVTVGEAVTVTLTSDAFDCYLYLYDATSCNQLAEDDDSAGNLDSRITYAAAQSGTLVIVATSLGGGESGDYVLDIETAAP